MPRVTTKSLSFSCLHTKLAWVMLTPYERARQVYETERCARTFEEDLVLHFLNGVVYSTPTAFLMGRGVDRNDTYMRITNPAIAYDRPNAWLIYLAAGNVAEFLKFEPYPLEWYMWERDNSLRCYPRRRVRQLCEKSVFSVVSGVLR